MKQKLIVMGASRTITALAALAVDLSMDDMRSRMRDCMREKFGLDNDGCTRYWIAEMFPEYVIATGPEEKLYRIPYSFDGDGNCQCGDPQEVEKAYIPVAQSACFLAADAATGTGDDDGWVWPVQIMAATAGSTGSIVKDGKRIAMRQVYPPEVIAQVAQAANGARLGRRHPVEAGEEQDPARFIGWLSDASFNGTAALAKANLLRNERDMRDKLMAARDAGKLDLFGLSVLAYFQFKPGKLGDENVLVAQSLGKLISVDMCGEPAAAGKFLAAASRAVFTDIAALQSQAIKSSPQGANHGGAQAAGRKTGGAMKARIVALLTALASLNTARAGELQTEFAGLAEDKHDEFLGKVAAAFSTITENNNTQTAQAALAQLQEVQDVIKKMNFKNGLEAKLAASKLPVPAQTLVRGHYLDAQGTVVQLAEDAALDADITRTRDAFAAFSNIGRIDPTRSHVTLDSADKVQLAVDQLLGVKDSAGKGVPAFRSLRQAYVTISGDHDLTMLATGAGFFARSAQAPDGTAATGDFANILLDAQHKLLAQEYAELGLNGLDMLYTIGAPITDFKTQNRVRDGYFGDLAIVAEGAAYPAINEPTDEKMTFAVQKRGGLLEITVETIRNDDLAAIARWPGKLARSARHTLKTYIMSKLKTPPNYEPDATAWFHANHNNLLAEPISVDALEKAKIAIYNQTEKDSLNPLGLSLDWIAVPINLWRTIVAINQSEKYNPGPGLTENNPFFHAFGANNERIVILETDDTNDWFYGTDKNNAPFLEIGFLDGQQTPQILLANDPRVGSMLTNDKLVYKVQWAFGGTVYDFRGIGKSVNA